jgi:predicted Zn finger-like uncharacterized protein
MIIQCEKCGSEFNIDETLLKVGGSKVRCSMCKNVFVAHPPEKVPPEEIMPDQTLEEELDETVSLEDLSDAEKKEARIVEGPVEANFDKAFEEALDEVGGRTVPAGRPPDLAEGFEREMAVERSPGIKEDLGWRTPKRGGSSGTQEIPRPVAAGTRPEFKPGRRILPIILVVILVLLAGGIAIFYLAPDLIPDSLSFLKPPEKEGMTDIGVRRLSFKAVTGSFTKSDKLGQLFVIKGMVTNNYPGRRSFILVSGAILDPKGAVVKRKMAYAGNIFKEDEIRTMSLEDIDKSSRNRFGNGRMNTNVEPGSSIPFMIIFENLPENISEFTVEAVRSSPVG